MLVRAALNFTMLMAALMAFTAASAAPQQLDCSLTDTGNVQTSTQSQLIIVMFDEDAKNIKAQEGGRNYIFSDVSISNVSMSGKADQVSLGIDRSTLSIVWQQYETDKVVTVYGQCRRGGQSVPTAH